jgi:hypothetical protein
MRRHTFERARHQAAAYCPSATFVPEGGLRDSPSSMRRRWSERDLIPHDQHVEELFEACDPALLDRPLPSLPNDVDEGDAVVIGRWAGPRWGALLYVINDGPDDYGEGSVDLDATSFRRVPGGWQESSSSGGGGWRTTEKPLLRRHELPPRAWALAHFHSGPNDGWHAPWAYGVAGDEAAWVEVTDIDGPVRRPLEAPLGYFIIAWNGDGPATVELLDRAGNSLGYRDLPQ